jgi:hypothetical protein
MLLIVSLAYPAGPSDRAIWGVGLDRMAAENVCSNLA